MPGRLPGGQLRSALGDLARELPTDRDRAPPRICSLGAAHSSAWAALFSGEHGSVITHLDLSQLDDARLRGLYAYPAAGLTVRANMVASVDGAATLAGTSGGLSPPADRRVFELLRGLADLIVVGAGTVRAEGYGAHRKLAIVSGSLDLDPGAGIFASGHRHLVIGCQRAEPGRRAALAEVAEVWLVGEESVELPRMLHLLEQRGYRRVLCEGGPHLLGQLVAEKCLHELCLTVSPVLAGIDAPRIVSAFAEDEARLRLRHALIGDDAVFLRYSLAQARGAPSGLESPHDLELDEKGAH